MPSLWKTGLGKYWERGGWCYNGLWCRWAHGTEELKPKPEPEAPTREEATSNVAGLAFGYHDRLEEDEVVLTPLSTTDSAIITAIFKNAFNVQEMPSREVMPLEYVNGLWHVATLSEPKKPEPQPQPKAMPVSFGSENFNNYYF